MIDVPLLRKAVEWVEEQEALPPRQREWRQSVWRGVAFRPAGIVQGPLQAARVVSGGRSCGTTYCVAGYIAEMTGGTWASNDTKSSLYQALLAEPDEEGAAWAYDSARSDRGPVLIVNASIRATNKLGIRDDAGLFNGGNTAEGVRSKAQRLVAYYLGEEEL